MAIIQEESALLDATLDIAKKMIVAARTAPKAKGISNLYSCIISGGDLQPIIAKMNSLAEAHDAPVFSRDAKNINDCDVLVLLGTTKEPLQLKKCGMCGFDSCFEKAKYPNIPCVFNTGDLGIAIGSAVSIAMDNRIDNRIMYTVGQAVIEMPVFPKEVAIVYGIPLKASSKNIFFDRNK